MDNRGRCLALGNFDKRKFAELLKKAKGDRSINNYALKSGVTAAHISRLSRGLLDTPPMPDTIKKLADHAHNDVQYKDLMIAAGHNDSKQDWSDLINTLFAGVGPLSQEEGSKWIRERFAKEVKDPDKPLSVTEYFTDLHKVDSVLRVPVLGDIAAGLPIFADENIESYMAIPNPNNYKPGDLFVLIVKGDSMEGSRIYEGDKVVVKIQPEVENGEIAVVNVNGHEATLKKVKKYEDGSVWLISTNEKYAPIPLNHSKARIIGKVIQVIFEP